MGYISSISYGGRKEEWGPTCHISAINDRLCRASYAVLRRLDFILKTIGNNEKILRIGVTR